MDIVVVIPAEFYINPNTFVPIGLTPRAAESEVRTAINIANQYYKPLNIRLNVVKVVNYTDDTDPYKQAYLSNDAFKMLETSVEKSDSYGVDYDIGLVVGRGYFRGTYGLAYESVTCTHPKFSQVFVTSAGLSEQKKYSFAHSIAHEIGHTLGMSHDDNSLHNQASIMATNYVAKPYGFSEGSLRKAQSRIDGNGGACFEKILTDDSDQDSYSDNLEEANGSSVSDCGSVPNIPSRSWYATWNSFLNLTNIVELLNRSDKQNTVEVKLKDIFGNTVDSKSFVLAPYSQLDLILNEWKGFVPSSYGTIEIVASELLDGRVALYSIKNGAHKFSTSLPFIKKIIGNSNLTFNTFFPYASSSLDHVQNWLTLVNLDSVVRSFRVSTFDSQGNVIKTRIVSLNPAARFDIEGGHEMLDKTRTGMHEIVPDDLSSSYIAYISRYGLGGNKDFLDVKFASVQVAAAPTGAARGNSIIIKDNAYSYLEVLNAKSSFSKFNLDIYSPNGEIVSSVEHELSGFSQIHLDLSSELAKRGYQVGNFILRPLESESICSELYNYKLGSSLGNVVTANLDTIELLNPIALSGSYNLFLNAKNSLVLSNFEDNQIEISITSSGNLIQTVSIPANGTHIVSLRDLQYFASRDSSYGTLELFTATPSKFSGALLREGSTSAFAGLMLESNFR